MRALLSAAFFLAFCMCLNGMPNRNPVANADEHGYAKFTKIDFPLDAKDRLLMFYLEFNSDPALEPGMHGAFWHIPAFYSKLAPVNGDEFNWLAPNGVTYYFCGHGIKKQGVNGAKSDTYTDNTGIWVATKKKNDVRIESLKDKSSFIYRNGRLLAFTVKGEKYNVRYAGVRGAVSSVSGESDSNAGLTFEYYDDLRHVKSIKTCKGVYKFKYHGRTPEDILGDDKAFSEVRLLSEIEYPDGKIQKIAYSRKPSVPRIRLSGNFSEEKADSAPVNRMNFKDPSGESGEWIEWFAKSGIISADSSGPYMVGSEADFEGRPGPRFIAIKHINPLKKHPHLYLFDRDNRFEIIGNPDSGEVLRYSKTGGCGIMRMKDRKIEKLKEGCSLGSPTWELVVTNLFNEWGEPFRTIHANGDVENFFFDSNGNVVQKTKNGVTTFYNGKPNEDGICFLEEKNSSVTKIESFRKNLYRIKSENAAGSANEFSVDAAANSISFQGVKIKITK